MNPRQNPALRATRRLTAGALVAAALVTGGVGVHLAQQSAAASSTVASGTTSGTSGTTSPGTTSGFGTTASVGAGSTGSVATTTNGS